jgi:23S rRNA (guanosine2251-2'-O)-methyltransferase
MAGTRKPGGGKGQGRRRRDESPPPAPEGIACGFHDVRTALKQSPRRVERVMLARGQRDGRTRELVGLARDAGIPFREVPKGALDRLTDGANHQGVAARLAAADLLELDELLGVVGPDPLLVVLDEVTDPHNVGAVVRSGAAFGVAGLVLPAFSSAGLSPVVRRVASGGLELVQVARAGNLGRALEQLERAGIRPVALDAAADSDFRQESWRGGVALVAGSEEKGLRPSVAKRCAGAVRIPVAPELGSLNVSVAVGIVLAEAARQRS